MRGRCARMFNPSLRRFLLKWYPFHKYIKQNKSKQNNNNNEPIPCTSNIYQTEELFRPRSPPNLQGDANG